MKISKKVQKKLEARQRGRASIVDEGSKHKSFNPRAHRVPGSRNPQK